MGPIQEFFTQPLGSMILNLLVALLILIVGYIVARILGSITRRLLNRTNLDNRLADWLSEPDERREFNIENIVASVVFWVVMLFVLVAFFERLSLNLIASPIQAFLERFTTEFLPALIAAGILLFVAWLIAMALRFLVIRGGALLKIDERLTRYAALKEEEQVSFTETLGVAVYWFTLLLFLPSVLSALGIQQVAASINAVFAQIFDYIPNILAAGVIVLVGWFIARVVRQIVEGLLKAIGTDQAGQRVGLSETRSLSEIVGLILYIFIFIVALIAALDALDIAAITIPATQMLSTVINVIPNLIGAALVLIIAYYVGRLVANLLRDLLSGIGLDTVPEKLGITWSVETPLSQWVGYLILLAIMLFATVSAAELLGSAALTEILNVFIAFFWKVVLGVIIFGIGLYFAQLAYNAVMKTGINQANIIGRLAQIAIVVFAAAIALRQIGIANEIISLAFGITLLAIGLAVALSFGLGTQKIAERELDSFLTNMRKPKDE
ncbi:MAG: mechanosensitive ion channel [Chloroflexota bacterium]|nr:MAG: mechanosensitive ion channel [Chloroflexota bacterium]